MDSQHKPPHQETIPELVARLVIAFEKKQAEKHAKANLSASSKLNNCYRQSTPEYQSPVDG